MQEEVKKWLSKNPLYLDTETTGLGNADELVELALVGSDGEIMINTLLRPTIPIPERATAIHGISDREVADSPTFADIFDDFIAKVTRRTVIIYNADFDMRLLRQSAKAHGLKLPPIHALCAMLAYASYYGDWNSYYKSYRWQSLDKAARQCNIRIQGDMHRALTDALACREVVLAMAREDHDR